METLKWIKTYWKHFHIQPVPWCLILEQSKTIQQVRKCTHHIIILVHFPVLGIKIYHSFSSTMFASYTFLSKGYLVSYDWDVHLSHADHQVAFIYCSLISKRNWNGPTSFNNSSIPYFMETHQRFSITCGRMDRQTWWG
jgi:hypothetical protein